MRFQALLEAKETMTLADLPYDMGALAPVMSRDTVHYHYDVLSRGYVDRFNKGEGDPAFNKAGALLHNMFWPQLMAPRINNQPRGISLQKIEDIHGDWIDFRDKFIDTAVMFRGSGWVYLAKDGSIKTLENQTWRSDIIMPIDVWEHSYYLDYPADRKAYMRSIWRIINWDMINDRFYSTS